MSEGKYDHLPFNAFPVWEYVSDEMEERGWSAETLAVLMGDEPDVNLCALDMLQAQAFSSPGTAASKVRLGDVMAGRLSRAFGTSKQLWLNLDESFQKAMNPEPAP